MILLLCYTGMTGVRQFGYPYEKESHFNSLRINKNGAIGSTKVSHDDLKFQCVSENLTVA